MLIDLRHPRRAQRALVALTVCVALLASQSRASAAAVTVAVAISEDGANPERDVLAHWQWPTRPAHVVAPFVAPAHDYGPGHRGIDLAAPIGSEVRSPAAGVVAFVGMVAGRGILTIDHGDGLVTTLEPVQSTLTAGTRVDAGAVVALVDTGGHAAAGTVHFGVREHGAYINPMLLLGGVRRAVLLPCC